MSRANGRRVGATNIPTLSVASGIWTPNDILLARKQTIWPTTGGIDSFTKLMLHMDGSDGSTTFVDSSLAPYTVTANGNAQIDTAQSKFGGSSFLGDGSGDYLSIADSADWDFPGDFTIDLWARFNSIVQSVFVGNYTGAGSGWTLQYRTDTTALRFMHGDTTIMQKSWSPSTNTWYHVAIIRTGSTMRMFIDGTQLGTDTTDATSFSGATSPLTVSRLSALGGGEINGWIDELRISKGIARWTANFTPPTEPYSY